jgi:hypothetical protein
VRPLLSDLPEGDPMSNEMHCPRCGSKNVECQPKPHMHRCHDCGYDGTQPFDPVDLIVGWLVETGYPFDYSHPGVPLPEPFRLPLAEAWLQKDGSGQETVDDYLDSLEAEGAWSYEESPDAR